MKTVKTTKSNTMTNNSMLNNYEDYINHIIEQTDSKQIQQNTCPYCDSIEVYNGICKWCHNNSAEDDN